MSQQTDSISLGTFLYESLSVTFGSKKQPRNIEDKRKDMSYLDDRPEDNQPVVVEVEDDSDCLDTSRSTDVFSSQTESHQESSHSLFNKDQLSSTTNNAENNKFQSEINRNYPSQQSLEVSRPQSKNRRNSGNAFGFCSSSSMPQHCDPFNVSPRGVGNDFYLVPRNGHRGHASYFSSGFDAFDPSGVFQLPEVGAELVPYGMQRHITSKGRSFMASSSSSGLSAMGYGRPASPYELNPFLHLHLDRERQMGRVEGMQQAMQSRMVGMPVQSVPAIHITNSSMMVQREAESRNVDDKKNNGDSENDEKSKKESMTQWMKQKWISVERRIIGGKYVKRIMTSSIGQSILLISASSFIYFFFERRQRLKLRQRINKQRQLELLSLQSSPVAYMLLKSSLAQKLFLTYAGWIGKFSGANYYWH